jgi:signal transduction histidine kinase
VSVSAEAEPGMVRFAVTDTGTGIAANEAGRVFEPFYRVPGQGQPSGIGLGLAIVQEIIRTHGGSVGVDSTPGRGSTFWFNLPQAGTAPAMAGDPARESRS